MALPVTMLAGPAVGQAPRTPRKQKSLSYEPHIPDRCSRMARAQRRQSPHLHLPIPRMVAARGFQISATANLAVPSTASPSGGNSLSASRSRNHRARAAILTLPANLILANKDVMVAVVPYRSNRQDILAFQSGKIEGRVTITKLDDAGRETEQAFPDARIIATGDRDTFSEAGGAFVLGDLPPGKYELHLDPATLPAGFTAAPAAQTVQVKAGDTVSDVYFHLVRPVIQRQAPPRPQK